MKILLFKYTTLGYKDLYQSLVGMGHEVVYVEYVPKSYEEDPYMEDLLMGRLSAESFDAVISFNYFQVISKVCFCYRISYIAWVWDSPLLTLYSPTIYNDTNYIFIFDKILYRSFKKQGINTVFHLPLAVNHKRLEQMKIDDWDLEKYTADISFVGRLYMKKISYDSMATLPDYCKGYIEAIMQAQTKIHGYNFLEEVLTEEVMKGICSRTEFYLGEKFTGSLRKVIADMFLGTKVTQLERTETLRNLAFHHVINLYTDESIDILPEVNHMGGVDYYDEMPKVFRLSKINLNITHRTIQSGIPLRIFDIMGAGGFVLTNYQPEISELFSEGEELVVYYDTEDLLRKVEYYLIHEEERRKIAEAGCNKVRTFHNYEVRLNQMLQIVQERQQAGEGDVNQ
ncbi:MAG TPA: glycosyltransferase [Clostridiales bacterium]|nr:glycosyltransferase [Clostridiales bacterium]